MLAPGGKIAYIGDRELAVSYFSRMGYTCPPETTTAEFFIDLVTIDTEDEEIAELDRDRINRLVDAFQKHQENIIKSDDVWKIDTYSKVNKSHVQPRPRRFYSRIAALLLRSLRQNFRDTRVNLLRGFASLGLAKLFSELFSGAKKGEPLAKGVADRPALISFGVINMAMMAVMKTINLFGREKSVVNREQMRNHYTSFDYLISKILAEIPLDMIFSSIFAAALKTFSGLQMKFSSLCATFSLLTAASASLGFAIGSFTNSVEEAMTVGMPLMVILMAVGIINPSGVDRSRKQPRFILLLKKLSPIGMAIEALIVAEFKGMRFDDGGRKWRLLDLPKMGGLALVQNGDQVLEALALEKKSYTCIMNDLAIICVFNLFLSWAGLSLCGTDFVQASVKKETLIEDKDVAENTTIVMNTSTDEIHKVPASRWFF